MKNFAVSFVAFIVTLIWSSVAFAEPVPGEVWVTLKGSDYAKPFYDGTEYEDHEFQKNGWRLVIRVDDLSTVYAFELRPSNSDLGAVTIETVAKKFKRKRVGRQYRMVMKAKVHFKPAPAAPAEPAKPAPIAPTEEEMKKQDEKNQKKEEAKKKEDAPKEDTPKKDAPKEEAPKKDAPKDAKK